MNERLKEAKRELLENIDDFFNTLEVETKPPKELTLPPNAKLLHANMENIGLVVKQVRIEQGLTQAQLAGACNTGQRFIFDLEKGKPTCEADKVFHILNMLGVKVYIQLPPNIHS